MRAGWIPLLALGCGGTSSSPATGPSDAAAEVAVEVAALPDVLDVAAPDEEAPPDVSAEDVALDVAPPPPAGWQRVELGAAGDLHTVRFLSGGFQAAGDGGTILRPIGDGWVREWTPIDAQSISDLAASDAVGLGGTWLTRGADGAWHAVATTTVDLHGAATLGADTLAVGAGGVILRRTGPTLVPEASGVTSDLLAVTAIGDDLAVAVGQGGVALHRQGGATWQQVQAAPPDVTLRGVHALGPKDVWAVGSTGSVYRFTGEWQAEPTADTRDLFAIDGGTSLLAVGDAGAFLVRAADGGWGIAVDVQGPLYTARRYEGVAAGGDRIVAAGEGGALQVKHLPKGPSLDASSRPASAIRDLAVHGDEAVAVGDDGLAVRLGPSGYGAIDSGTTADLLGLDIAPIGTIWAVGVGGTLVRLQDGAPPVSIATGTSADLHAVRLLGDGSAIVVGAAGVVLHVSASGAKVESEPTPTGEDLLDVFSEGATLVAVGRGGTILRRESGTWTSMDAGVAADLHAGDSDGSNAVVVGDFGTIVRWSDGGVPTASAADPAAFYAAVDVDQDGAATVVGWAGALVHLDASGATSPLEAPTSTPLYATARLAGRLLVGGANGELWTYLTEGP